MNTPVADAVAINELLARYGVKFGIYKNGTFKEQLFPFDAIPRVISAMEKGLIQRVDALNLFLKDIYSQGKIIRDGVIPEDFVYISKGYLAPCAGITPPKGIYSHISGIDLVQAKDGEWYILEDNLRIPSGASYPLIARELSERLQGSMTYLKGVTGTETTAEQAMALGSGVCQDYAHILLSLLRLEKIPCRYVSGLAFESGETHAWIEVFENGRWTGIDPTQNRLIGDNYIKLCHGRDYSDCPIERGIYTGSAQSVQTVLSRMAEI